MGFPEYVEQSADSGTQQAESNNSSPSTEESNNQELAQAIAELDKMEKFKFQGQEWTPKDLEKAIMRQKDYTQKTQSLGEERKSLEAERKFYENLAWDIKNVQENPHLAAKFIEVYPEKFHTYLKQALQNSQPQTPKQAQQPQSNQFDVDTASRLKNLENVIFQQEVAKNENLIDQNISKFSKKYPDADSELALAKLHDAKMAGEELTDALWEKAFKSSHERTQSLLKSRYGDLVKKQTEANSKARDVEGGGGTPGRAPKKFGSLGEVTKDILANMNKS